MKNKTMNILFASLLGMTLGISSFVAIAKFHHSEKTAESALAWSGNQTPNIGNYYSQITDSMTGSTLQAKLKQINPSMSKSYDWSRYEAADEAEGTTNQIISIYTRHNIAKSSHCGNYAWDKWNREHIWTQTAYPNSDTDNHNIFACEGQINGYRGNLPYDELEHTESNRVTVFGHATDCYKTSSKFEPCDEAKGEVARSVMYGAVIYDYTITQMIPIDIALKWNIQHPVTNRDIYRNNTVQSLQGNRNPFVDHPEYACRIWGNTNSKTQAICNGSIPDPVTVTLDKTSQSVEAGSNFNLTATTSDSSNVAWTLSSGGNQIVSLSKSSSASGEAITVTGLKAGTATITATSGGSTASCAVTVTGEPQTEPIKLNFTNKTLALQESFDLIATTKDQSNITWTFDEDGWEILNFTKIETASGEALNLKAIKNGTTIVTATSGNNSVTCTIICGTGERDTPEDQGGDEEEKPDDKKQDDNNMKLIIGLSVGGGSAVLIAGVVVLVVLLTKKKPI